MVAVEYIFPGLVLLGCAFFFLEIGFNLTQKEELKNKNSVFSFVDLAKFFFFGLSIFFLFMTLLFGRAVVDNSVTNMAGAFDVVQSTFAISIFVMFIGFIGYVFFIIPWAVKKQFDAARRAKEDEENGGVY